MFTLSVLCFCGQLLEQLNVASLSNPTVSLQCYLLLLLYFGQINDDDDEDDDDDDDDDELIATIICINAFKLMLGSTKITMFSSAVSVRCLLLKFLVYNNLENKCSAYYFAE